MTLDEVNTPCLVLDRAILARNVARMAADVARHGVALRPHLKTAKCIEAARMALEAGAQGITVSTLAEAAFFAGHGIADQIYAVGITPQKLDRVAALNAAGADVKAITDDPATAAAIAAHPGAVRALVEVDVGEHRGGVEAAGARLEAVAAALGPRLAGVLSHSGHSYAGRSDGDMARIAEEERAVLVGAAERLRAAGHMVPIVSAGSSPTARHAVRLDGLTEVRAGVYMFGDLFQAGIGTHGLDDIAVTVLASVIGVRPGVLVIDAGGLALSKDRSTAAGPVDYGFGLVTGLDGRRIGLVTAAYQEHGMVACEGECGLRVGDRVRVAPNHTCMTVAAHDRYHVIEGVGQTAVTGVWPRVNFW